MTRAQRSKVIREFYRSLAVELHSHLASGSGFIYLNKYGESEENEVVELRKDMLEREYNRLFKKGEPL